ncbi:hypothetical protein [Nonomuraea rhizosphaerae]|uniref:hypothetical protein n=1 Tax=Nonomuraea rhizosphaerae TaxID=2665663 RepID=UPI001C5D4A84|nr:hypothetical protein [Nonomuraea rhizosphaerae]
MCRRHSPFSPGTAEREANQALEAAFINHATLKRRWVARVEVSLTKEARDLERENVVRQHAITANAKAVAMRLRALDDLRRQAETFLAGLNTSWASRYAVKLAQQPELAAEVVHRMLEDRRQDAEHLVDTVQRMVEAHQTANIYDLVISSEGALRQALEQLGVALPPLDPDPLFTPADIPR